MFIPKGPEDNHFIYDITFKDNLQFVNSKFLKNIRLTLNNSNHSNSDLVELHATSPLKTVSLLKIPQFTNLTITIKIIFLRRIK